MIFNIQEAQQKLQQKHGRQNKQFEIANAPTTTQAQPNENDTNGNDMNMNERIRRTFLFGGQFYER